MTLPLMGPSEVPRRRHVWVDSGTGGQDPGLVLAWRPDGRGGWEAKVAIVHTDAVLVDWRSAGELHPVTDDRWQLPGASLR